MKYMVVLIVVEDVQKSRHLYETILGQKVKLDYGENLTFESNFAIHQRAHFQSLIDGAPVIQKSNSFELCFEDDDLESLLHTLKDHQIEFLHEIREQPWRQQVLRFYDFDKNLIEVGERMEHVAYRLYLEGKPTDEIAKTTYLDKEAVLQAIKEYS
jgi:catechol 2,3-dioxygenase-like lactoylglutathione lyase family enzyme